MPEHIVFSTERFAPSDHDDVRFEEVFDFGDFHAAHVHTSAERAEHIAAAGPVTGVYPNFEVSIDTAPLEFETEITTDTVVSDDDIRQVHDIPDDAGTGAGLSVVVMDSGRDASQFDPGMEIPQTDMTDTGDDTDDVGHGTATMGLVHELAPDADLHALRIFGSEGSAAGNVILRGYQWLLNHADAIDVVNMSWGGSQDIPEIDTLHEKLINKGVLCVVSAGNSGGPSGSPAVAPHAFSVGAITLDGSLTSFSSFNPSDGNPDVCALGKNNLLLRASGTSMGTPVSVADDGTVTPDENGDQTVASGTSFSAPICSGLSCLLLTTNGVDVSLSDIPQTEDESSTDIPGTNHDGNGIVKLAAAIDAVRPDEPEQPSEPDTPDNPDKPSGPEPVEVDHTKAKSWNFGPGELAWIDGDLLPSGDLTAVKYDDGHVELRPADGE